MGTRRRQAVALILLSVFGAVLVPTVFCSLLDTIQLWHVALAASLGQIVLGAVGWTVGRHGNREIEAAAIDVLPPPSPSELLQRMVIHCRHHGDGPMAIACRACMEELDTAGVFNRVPLRVHDELPPNEER